MIAKVIAHGATRDEARRQLIRGIEDIVALGVQTNQEFLARCLSHRVFAAGEATTAFIAQHETELVGPDVEAAGRAALVGAWLLHETGAHARHAPNGRSLPHRLPLGMRFALDGTQLDVSISQVQPQTFKVELDGEEHALEAVSIAKHEARFILQGVMERVAFDRDGPSLWFRLGGRPHMIADHSRAAASRDEDRGSDGRVRASMNGRVVALLVAAGDKVSSGQPLLTLEAMKMEHVHCAPVQGVVSAVQVTVGEQVQAKSLVVEILPDGAQGAAT
jgi:geranyl-CoA carboxylase alpha subunit